MSDLSGRGAVITGGGRGIGAEVARWLAGHGASVVVAARSQDEIDAVAAELTGAGHDAWALSCDVADPDSVRAMTAGALERLGAVDILVNNAGVAPSGPVRKIPPEEWNRTLAVNTTGVLLCIQAFWDGMVERGWGRIVTVASIASLFGAKYIGAYAASKHAVLGLTRCAAAEAAAHGVTVNAVCPGYVDTDMTRVSLARIMEKTGISEEEALSAILSTTPQRRLIDPEEVAHGVGSLCVEEARGINGTTLVIDGGELMR